MRSSESVGRWEPLLSRSPSLGSILTQGWWRRRGSFGLPSAHYAGFEFYPARATVLRVMRSDLKRRVYSVTPIGCHRTIWGEVVPADGNGKVFREERASQ